VRGTGRGRRKEGRKGASSIMSSSPSRGSAIGELTFSPNSHPEESEGKHVYQLLIEKIGMGREGESEQVRKER